MKLELTKPYVTGLKANTDIHAGGIFFGIVYRDCLHFFENGTVEFTKTIVDPFRPMGTNELEWFNNFKQVGTYSVNNLGHLICKFESLFWSFAGMPTTKDENIFLFHIYDSRLQQTWSEVYTIE